VLEPLITNFLGLSQQQQIIFVFVIEGLVFLSTLLFLVQPEFVWRNAHVTLRGVAGFVGWLFTLVLFFWSFVVGVVLFINKIDIKFW